MQICSLMRSRFGNRHSKTHHPKKVHILSSLPTINLRLFGCNSAQYYMVLNETFFTFFEDVLFNLLYSIRYVENIIDCNNSILKHL